MSQRLRFPILVLFLTVFFFMSVALAQETATLTGSVVDKEQRPLPGATVTATPATGGSSQGATTDASGRYQITGLAAGSYRVTASLADFATAEVQLSLSAGETQQPFTLEAVYLFENITVSPLKREQQLLDVPASITAVGGDALKSQSATSITELAATIPALSMVDTGPGQQRAQLRGISSAQNLPTIGLYLDEAPISIDAASAGADQRLLDMDRVEVLRGPQGVLYGASAMGGLIRYVTKDPLLTRSEFELDANYATVKDGSDTYRTSLVANLPVIEGKFGLRLLGAYEKDPGWVDYPSINSEDVNEGDSTTLRAKALWLASDKLTASLLLQSQDSEYDGQPFAEEDRTAPGYILEQPISEKSTIGNLVLNYDAGSFGILSSTGFLDRENDQSFDFSTLFVPIFDLFGFPPGTVTSSALIADSQVDMLTQEVRFASNGDSSIVWTAGVYYRDYESDNANFTVSEGNPLPFDVLLTQQNLQSTQYAAFGEVTFDLTSKLEAALGARYFSDKRETKGLSGSFAPPVASPEQSDTFTSFDPRVVLTYRPTDRRLIYFSAAKGFRSGGFNAVVPGCGLDTSYDPETLWTYELGGSASSSTGAVVFQGAVYYNNWTDIQTLTICPNLPLAQTANVGEASGQGVDAQLTFTPRRGLRFILTGNYNESEYDADAQSFKKGDQIDYVPDYTLGVAADWSFGWSRTIPGALNVTYQQTGEFTITLRNAGLEPLSSEVVEGLSTRLSARFGAVELAVFARNLTDDNSAVQPAIIPGAVLSAVRQQPRTLGVGLTWRY